MGRWSRRSRSSRPAKPHGVILPSAARFMAKNTVGERRACPVEVPDGAMTDRDGNVQLRDGSYLHGVELIPVHLAVELTETEKEVLLCVLDVLGLKKDCFRPLDPELVPDLEVLDFALVAQVGAERKSPNLKAHRAGGLQAHAAYQAADLGDRAGACGPSRPRSGTRARPRSSIATISPSSV